MKALLKQFEHALMGNPFSLMVERAREHVRKNPPPPMDRGFKAVVLAFTIAFTWSIVELVIFLNQ